MPGRSSFHSCATRFICRIVFFPAFFSLPATHSDHADSRIISLHKCMLRVVPGQNTDLPSNQESKPGFSIWSVPV
jgi:hypothetical protein